MPQLPILKGKQVLDALPLRRILKQAGLSDEEFTWLL